MAVLARGKYYTNSGWVPAIVTGQYDDEGAVVADEGETADVETVDVVLLGWDNGKRTGVAVGTDVNEFEFVDTVE
jgi:hypothetical protein